MDFKETKKNIISELEIIASISNFEKEYQMNRKNNLKFLNKVAVLLLFLVLFSGSMIFAYIGFNRIIKENKVYIQGSVKEAEESGYLQKVEMEYAYSEGIGAKVKEISISDNDFNIVLDFNFTNKKLENNNILLNYIVYDENNNIYGYGDATINQRGKNLLNFYKEMKIQYNKDDWYEGIYSKYKSQNNLMETENKLKTQISFKADERFPKSKKIYVRIFEIGYMSDSEYIKLVKNTDWILDVNLSDTFYNRESIDYKLKNEVEEFTLDEAYVTDTSMTIKAKIGDLSGSIKDKIIVVDENGKEYISENLSGRDGEQIVLYYSINKRNITSQMQIKVLLNNQYIICDLERIAK